MKRKVAIFILASLLCANIVACGSTQSSSAQASSSSTAVAGSQSDTTSSTTSQEAAQPAVTIDMQQAYDALATAAGLSATIAVTEIDLNAGGGITVDNIVDMQAGQSKIGGDSGLVILLQVQSGTADTMVKELQGYRDSLISGPNYEEFATAKAATEQARIAAYGDYVVYAAISVESQATYEDVDAALAGVFES